MERKELYQHIIDASENLNSFLEELQTTFKDETVDANVMNEELGFEEYTAFMDQLYDVMGAISEFLP